MQSISEKSLLRKSLSKKIQEIFFSTCNEYFYVQKNIFYILE